jgi:hypothetical protein
MLVRLHLAEKPPEYRAEIGFSIHQQTDSTLKGLNALICHIEHSIQPHATEEPERGVILPRREHQKTPGQPLIGNLGHKLAPVASTGIQVENAQVDRRESEMSQRSVGSGMTLNPVRGESLLQTMPDRFHMETVRVNNEMLAR